MLENEKIIKHSYFYKKRGDSHLKKKFYGTKHRYFILGIIIGLAIVIATYFCLDISRVYKVSVDGNIYLSDEKIRELSGIDDNSIFIFTFPSRVENRIKENPLIKSVDVSLEDYRLVKVNVIEKKILGYLNENGEAYYLLEDNSRILIDDSNIHLLSNVPLIEGYTSEQLEEIIKGFNDLDQDLLNQISEIHRYPFSYDENMLEVIMKDGNYVFVSSYGLNLLNQYYTVVSGISNTPGYCIYLDEVTNSGYSSACPWSSKSEVQTEKDDDIQEEEVS